MNRVAESDKLMYDTIHMDEEAVAAQIEKIHFEETVSKALENYGGDILLAGINYDKAAPAEKRKHTCKIEKYTV